MRPIQLLLLSFLLISCNTARKTNTDIRELEKRTDLEKKTDSGTKTENASSSYVDISRFVDEFGLSIKGDGNQYSLNYGGLKFTGSADLELKKKTDSYRVIYIYHDWNIYHNWNVTKTWEITKTNYKTKVKNTEAEKDNFWAAVLIFCTGMAFMLFLVFLWNSNNLTKHLTNIFNQWIK